MPGALERQKQRFSLIEKVPYINSNSKDEDFTVYYKPCDLHFINDYSSTLDNKYLNSFFNNYNEKLKENDVIDRDRKRLRPDWEYYDVPKNNDLDSKNAIMDDLIKFMNSYEQHGIKRSSKQIEFHNEMLPTTAVSVYKAELFNKYKGTIGLRYNWSKEDLFHQLSIVTARRFGKTHTYAMFLVGHLICNPQVQINIFTPSKVQSNMLLDTMKYYYNIISPKHLEIIVDSKNEFRVKFNERDTRVVTSWPSSVDVSLNRILYRYIDFNSTILFGIYKCKYND
jgi:hypothetical protein